MYLSITEASAKEEIDLTSIINRLPEKRPEETTTVFMRIICLLPFIRKRVQEKKAREFDEIYQNLNADPIEIILEDDAKQLSYKVRPQETVVAYNASNKEKVEYRLTDPKEGPFKFALGNVDAKIFSTVKLFATQNR